MGTTPEIYVLTAKERLRIKEPHHRMMVRQTDEIPGIYIYFMDDWLKLRPIDFLHIENNVKSMTSITGIMNREGKYTEFFQALTSRLMFLENIVTVSNHKFEIVITVCLIVMKAVGAINMNWIWVLSPMIASVLFTLVIGLMTRHFGPRLPGDGADGKSSKSNQFNHGY